MLKKKKFIIGGILLLAAIVFLGYLSFMGGVTYYYEVGEFLDKADTLNGQTVRISGIVADDVERDGLEITFTLTDNTGADASLTVFYTGAVPDTFGVDKQVVVEGEYSISGVFEADSIITKCGSKYIPEEIE